jgi:hypothetical protein
MMAIPEDSLSQLAGMPWMVIGIPYRNSISDVPFSISSTVCEVRHKRAAYYAKPEHRMAMKVVRRPPWRVAGQWFDFTGRRG